MDSATAEYLALLESEIKSEILAQDLIYHRFRYVCFVSKSKGRGRKRRHWQEIELIQDRWNGAAYRVFEKYSFDRIASEMVPDAIDDIEAERKLINRIKEVC